MVEGRARGLPRRRDPLRVVGQPRPSLRAVRIRPALAFSTRRDVDGSDGNHERFAWRSAV